MIKQTQLEHYYHDWYTHPEYNHGDNAAFFEHMPVLRLLCHNKRVLELGARYGTSTLAILAAHPFSLTSVDIERRETITALEQLAAREGVPFTFVEMDDLKYSHDETYEILFIDTLHTYGQLAAELNKFHGLATEYIVMHDLVSFGRKNEDGAQGKQGLIPAMEEFIAAHSDEWEVAAYWYNCNGLMVFRRIK